jgi:hypothetical protein
MLDIPYDQRIAIRIRIAQLCATHTRQEISNILSIECGIKLSKWVVRNEIRKIQEPSQQQHIQQDNAIMQKWRVPDKVNNKNYADLLGDLAQGKLDAEEFEESVR